MIWLESNGLASYAALFIKEELFPDSFSAVTDQLLEKIGIQITGHRVKILKAIKNYLEAIEGNKSSNMKPVITSDDYLELKDVPIGDTNSKRRYTVLIKKQNSMVGVASSLKLKLQQDLAHWKTDLSTREYFGESFEPPGHSNGHPNWQIDYSELTFSRELGRGAFGVLRNKDNFGCGLLILLCFVFFFFALRLFGLVLGEINNAQSNWQRFLI